MEIRIEFEDTEPPRGRTFDAGSHRTFGGWLELIRAIEELLERGHGAQIDKEAPALQDDGSIATRPKPGDALA